GDRGLEFREGRPARRPLAEEILLQLQGRFRGLSEVLEDLVKTLAHELHLRGHNVGPPTGKSWARYSTALRSRTGDCNSHAKAPREGVLALSRRGMPARKGGHCWRKLPLESSFEPFAGRRIGPGQMIRGGAFVTDPHIGRVLQHSVGPLAAGERRTTPLRRTARPEENASIPEKHRPQPL